MRPDPCVAVVTVAHGRHQHLSRLQRTLSTGDLVPDHWVLVSMSDPALEEWRTVYGVQPQAVRMDVDPTALPLAAARNLGAQRALDLGAEVLVFLDADVLVAPGLVQAYADVVRRHPHGLWSGPVTYLAPGLDERQLAQPWLLDDPHPARPAPAPGEVLHDAPAELFWSLSFALTADTWHALGGFHEDYTGYGGEDTDLAFAARRQGIPLGWVGSARAYHQHHPTTDPPVQHLDAILRNAALFHRRWDVWPMEGWLTEFERLGLVRRTEEGWERWPTAAHAS
jgi:N-acetylglucosaminyl-diphospho-decaprenol L-rhamnosyltransferase